MKSKDDKKICWRCKKEMSEKEVASEMSSDDAAFCAPMCKDCFDQVVTKCESSSEE